MFRAIYIALLTVTFFAPHHARAHWMKSRTYPHLTPRLRLRFKRHLAGQWRGMSARPSSPYACLQKIRRRTAIIFNGIDPTPPVVWEMDWLSCSALQGTTGEIAEPVAILAEYYGSEYFQAKDASGKMLPIPGPGRSPELARCWSSVNDGKRMHRQRTGLARSAKAAGIRGSSRRAYEGERRQISGNKAGIVKAASGSCRRRRHLRQACPRH